MDGSSDIDQPLITVVVVTWNGKHLLRPCLDSLTAQSLLAHRVIVVDNASEDGTDSLLRDEYPQVEVIKSDVNRGFAGGANLGLKRAETRYVALLNNDARADHDFLKSLVAAFEAEQAQQVGAVTAKVLLDGTDLLNSTGNLVSRTGRGFDRDWRVPDDRNRPGGDVFGFCGAAAALRRSALDEVGAFDENLFLYYEDTDLSWRLRAAGWSVRYEPAAVARHRHASSSTEGSPRFHFWNERNSLVVFTRHAPLALVLLMLLRRTVGLAVHTVREGPVDAVTRARWRAAVAYLQRLPRTARERRSTWTDSRCTRHEVASLLTARPGA